MFAHAFVPYLYDNADELIKTVNKRRNLHPVATIVAEKLDIHLHNLNTEIVLRLKFLVSAQHNNSLQSYDSSTYDSRIKFNA